MPSKRTRSNSNHPTRSRARTPDALRILKEDHARVRSLFDQFEKADSRSWPG